MNNISNSSLSALQAEAIINSITDGLIAVDRNLNLFLINSHAMKLFDILPNADYRGRSIIEFIRNMKIETLLRETIDRNTPMEEEISLGIIDASSYILQLNTNPISPANSEQIPNTGAVLYIQDVTKIRKLEKLRYEFVSNVTHELKTPLTSIRGFVETLRSGALENPGDAERFLEIIDIEAERLHNLINDVLYLSEIETSSRDSNLGTHRLRPIADEVVSMLQKQADRMNISLEVNIDDNLKMYVNGDRIKQMLINLVDNAVKYNIENGRVLIEAKREKGHVAILVKDTGIGIPKEHQDRLFERFYRVDRGRSRSMGGTGLGLSIVKHIVNLYNGDIHVKSNPGTGSEFLILLPL